MISKVQGVNGTGNILTLAYGSAVTAGSLLTVTFRNGALFSTQSVSDNINGAWTMAYHRDQTTDGHTLCVAYFKGSAAGSITVTCVTPGGTNRMLIEEWSATNGFGVVGTPVSAMGATPLSSGNVTAGLGDLVYGGMTNNNGPVADWVAGGTSAGGTWAISQDYIETTHSVATQYVVATAGGTFASFATQASFSTCTSGVITFSELAAVVSTKQFAPHRMPLGV